MPMRIYNTTSDRMPSATAPLGNEPPAPQTWIKDDCLTSPPVRNGHLREAITRDRLDPQEQVELLNTSASSASFTASNTAMGDSRQPPSIGGSKVDLCPDNITFSEGGPWKRRTLLEKCLIVLALFLFLAAVGFLALFLVFRLEGSDTGNMCTTLECLQTAAYISNSINPEADPCEDFYQFACGKWIDKNPLTPVLPTINNFVLIQKDLQEYMRDLLTENDTKALASIQKARIFFRSCEDTDAIDAKGNTPMLDLLRSGGPNIFPTLQPDWVDENMTLNQMLARVGAVGGLGSSPLITMGIHSDQKQSERNIVYLTQTGYFLPSRQLFLGPRNNSILRLYERLYVDVMTSLGADFSTARRDAVALVDFEIIVANATSPPELRRDAEKLYNKMTIQQITRRYPQFDWLIYLQRHFSPEGIRLTENEEVVINALDYYDKIFPIIEASSRRTLLNYCMWRIVYPLVGLLSKPLQSLKRQFQQSLNGAARSPERWKECVTITDTKFPHAAGRLYVDHHFSQNAKTRVEDMIRNLVSSFKDMLHETDWMSEGSKRAALEKADAIIYKIGYSDEIMNDTILNEKTANISITDDAYFDNHLKIFLHSRRKTLRKLREPVNREEWPLSAATVNAFYNRQTNEILFPAGILHKPFFSEQYLDALNYGGIGFVIGHEITHGFDDSGRSFDKDGNLHMWWTEEDLERFKHRTDCMVKQYSNYTEPRLGRKVNGRLTIGEDIADNGGLKEAYRAYRKLVARRGKEEPKLPVLDYTPDQLFFISAAQAWCGNMRDKLRLIYLQTDYHSPMRFRVIGPMQNNEDFSRAFSCPVGSYMNPERKCRVW